MTATESDGTEAPTEDVRVPHARRFDHVGLSVPDLDEAVAFFVEGFGAEVVFRMERPATREPVGADRLGADARAQFALAMLALGGGRLELLQWWSPRAPGDIPPVDCLGGTHVAIEVADVAEALSRLSQVEGVSILSDALTFTEGPTPGLTNAFARAPFGALLELVSWGWPDV